MRVLIDTHVLLWLVDEKKAHNIGKGGKRTLEKSLVYVSPLSITEVILKAMLGKLPEMTIDDKGLEEARMQILPYSMVHARYMQNFQSLAKHDPFDRMLLAQALAEDMIFLTADRVLLDMNLKNVVDASV